MAEERIGVPIYNKDTDVWHFLFGLQSCYGKNYLQSVIAAIKQDFSVDQWNTM